MSRKRVLFPLSVAISLALGLLLSRRGATTAQAPAEAQPRPPDPGRQASGESHLQSNASLVIGSCQIQTGGGSIRDLKIRVGPSPLLMLLTGAAIALAVQHLLSHRGGCSRQ